MAWIWPLILAGGAVLIAAQAEDVLAPDAQPVVPFEPFDFVPPFEIVAPAPLADDADDKAKALYTRRGEIRDCAAVAPVLELSTISRYDQTDKSRSRVDEERKQAYDSEIAPVREFTKAVVRHANRYVRSGGTEVGQARCTLKLLDDWAEANAMFGTQTPQAEFNRSTFLAGVSLAYLQVSRVDADSDEHARIKQWIGALATMNRHHYDQRETSGRSARNNHRYWAGLGIAAAGGATGNRILFDWGMQALRVGLCEIDAQGRLPLEIARQRLALSYHFFALSPLVTLNEFAQQNGIRDVSGDCDPDGLHRLVAFALASLDNPQPLSDELGFVQDKLPTPDSDNAQDLAWLVAYDRRYGPANPWHDRLPAMKGLTYSYLGGDQKLLYRYDPIAAAVN